MACATSTTVLILGLRQIRLRLGQLCLGLHELGLILALVEGEEHLPRLDHLAFVVALLQQEGFHPGANIHRVGGVDARGQFGENRHGLLNDRGNDDGDGGTGGSGLGIDAFLASAACQQHDGADTHGNPQ